MPFLFSLALMIVSYTISALLVKRPVATPPAALTDFQFPQFEEGTPQTVYFGDCWTTGWMVLWYGNLQIKPIKSKAKKK